MSIVGFHGTFMNKDLMSNDTILYSFDNFCCFNSSMNSLVIFTMFLDCCKDINSQLYKDSIKTGHQPLEISDYRIIGNGYGNNWNKQIDQAFLIIELKPTLNKQDKLIPLKLFN